MKKNLLYAFLLIIVAITVVYIFYPINNSIDLAQARRDRKAKREFSDGARLYQEFLMLRDPKTNRIPANIRNLELRFAEQLPKHFGTILLKGSEVKNSQALTWTERGPNNVAGRIRALAIDIRTTGTPTILAGGASGGMWKSTDGGSSWTKKTTASQLHSVTCVAQDTRVGSQDIWYYGTGENVGNSAGGEGATYLGNGVFKSTDNGETWTQLTATNTADNTSFSSDWQYIFNIAVHPTSGRIYAATTGGVYRSIDGGTNWTKVLNPNNSNTLKTDVTIASDGTIYSATSSDGGDIVGIRKSTDDGDNWTNVSPTLPATYGRTIIKTAPSSSGVVYFFTEGVSGANNTPNVHNHQLWRSADAGSNWTNISSVIPANTAPTLDNLSTQNGYDMLLSVKPDNPNFIIVGGVSIFKIHDVTNDTQTLAEKHIGGYGIAANNTANALNDFKNHHPDNHIGVFKPGSNIIFYCGNDGGVHLANDITAASSGTFWETPIRTGLNVSQFYNASLDKTNGSGFISGGLQDRGNWMARTTGALQSWQEVSGGDGCFTEIDPSGTNVFMSTTNGNIFRFAKTDATSPVAATTAMKPATLNNPLFVNPFDVDDNSGDIIYFSGGTTGKTSGIWRSTDASAETPNWAYFVNSEVAGEQVSAITVSKAGSANVLYYGTSGGKVFRIDAANTADVATTTPTNITGGFPAGYVSSIAVDPANSANVMVTFSNYNVDRIWYSTNSGGAWTSVTGNLTGANSPSVRWAKMFSVSGTPHYFLATSTGVYYTTNLNGGSTSWTQEGTNTIGNVVVTTIDYRASDGVLIAATHGRGVFETTIATPLPVELTSFAATYTGDGVLLNWQTATEVNNYGFNVERRTNNESWIKIGFVQGHGNSNSSKTYSYLDKDAPSGKVYYRLKQIDFDGKFEYSNIVEVSVNVLNRLELQQNFPNPFNPVTTISYNLPNVSKVKLVVYDVTGREVATLINEFQSAGKHYVNFNASRIASGVYYYRIQAGEIIQTKKMILVK